MATLQIETPPAVEAITLTDAKNFLRVEITDDDVLIGYLITAAREACEAFTSRSFVNKGYIQCLDSFPYYTDTVVSQMAYPPSYYAMPRYSTTLWNYSQMIKLFVSPLVTVNRITYLSDKDQQFHDLVPAPNLWYPQTSYTASPAQTVTDNNGNVQVCISPGKSGIDPPVWNKTVGGITTEASGVQWQNQGPVATSFGGEGGNQFGPFIFDNQSEPPRIFPGPPGVMWPSVLYAENAVQIHYTAGYGSDGTNVPGVFKIAMLQLIANWYENREAAMSGGFRQIPNQVQMLLWSKRVYDMQPTRG
jgi:hypothetical protein